MYQWHYTLTGNPDLPNLVLLHGWMGSSADYQTVIELIQTDFYCLAIDLPGHGNTQVLGDDTGYEFTATARGIIQLLDSLAIDRCTIAGYSCGGRLALYLALEYPHRFDRAILESTSPGLATVAAKNARIASDREVIRQLQTIDLREFIAHWYQQPIFQGISDCRGFDDLIQRRLTNQPHRLAKSLQYAGLAQQPYLGDRLAQHQQPVLLMVGEGDRKFVEINCAIGQTCKCTTLEIVPNCSHNIHFSEPELWVQLVRLSRTEGDNLIRSKEAMDNGEEVGNFG